MRFILLLGVVSLLADMTYEGARSITGPYLGLLGASAAVVGAVAGAGEMIGYVLRLASGYLTDRTRKYWTIALVGYGVNLLAVPSLALAGHWEAAALLLMTERAGKAIRVPARDVMLAAASKSVGSGWTFGVHEALDRMGGLSGPLVVALMLATTRSYRASFTVLLVPALAALSVLLVARSRYPQPEGMETERVTAADGAVCRARSGSTWRPPGWWRPDSSTSRSRRTTGTRRAWPRAPRSRCSMLWLWASRH